MLKQVVVTNQITTHVSHDLGKQSDWSDEDFQGDWSVVTAALGNSWSHCVNTRLLLQYMHGGRRLVGLLGCDGGNKVHSYLLQLTIAKSPVCDSEGFVVTIEEKGLLLDWVATGTKNNCLSSHPISFPKTKSSDPRCHERFFSYSRVKQQTAARAWGSDFNFTDSAILH